MRSSTLLNCVLSLIVLAAASSAAHAAPFTNRGPGGMGTLDGSSSLELWLKSDTQVYSNAGGTIAAVNGGSSVRWNDLSGNGRNAIADVGGREPTYNTGVLNGAPVLNFSGGALNTGSRMKVADAATPYPFTGNETALFAIDFTAGFGCCRGIMSDNNVFGNEGYDGGAGGMFESAPYTFSADYRINGVNTPTTAAGFNAITGLPVSTPVGNRALILGSGHGGNPDYAGRMGEVILFSTALNAAQQIIAENYVSSRNDITLSAGDHYNGDTAGKGQFDFDVFGVGRASDASLQLNGGMAGFGIQTSAPGSEAWALAGHASGSNGVTSADMPTGTTRWERSWYVDTTGTVGTVDLAFDWNDALNSATFDPSLVGLYYRSSNSGPFLFLAVGTLDITNQRVDFTGITLSDEFYYTLGSLPVPEPSTFALLGLGIVGMAVKARRRRRAAA